MQLSIYLAFIYLHKLLFPSGMAQEALECGLIEHVTERFDELVATGG